MSTTLISRSSADRQAGATTIATSLVKGLLSSGIDAIYIAPTMEQAHWAAKHHGLPLETVTGWNPLRFMCGRRFRTVVLDGVLRFDWSEGDPVELVKRTQMIFSEPCQIISFD